jgi:adenylate cyclase class 2
MPDQHEIETKFVLGNPEEIRARLMELGAVSHGRHMESNIRLDDNTRSLSSNNLVLRLRTIQTNGETKHLLTLKVPTNHPDQIFRVRREIETYCSDREAMLSALAVLGYTPFWRYEKRREVFSWEGVEVVIDELPYGWFLELEGQPAAIRSLADQLGLKIEDGLALSYAEIFFNVRSALGLDLDDLTFNAFKGIHVPPDSFRGKHN